MRSSSENHFKLLQLFRVATAIVIAGCLVSACVSKYAAHSPVPMRNPKVMRVKSTLLKRLPKPNCDLQTALNTSSGESANAAQARVLSERIRLEFERDCYQTAAYYAMDRLRKLQAAVRAAQKIDRRRARHTN